jgi:hypothetical protein
MNASRWCRTRSSGDGSELDVDVDRFAVASQVKQAAVVAGARSRMVAINAA